MKEYFLDSRLSNGSITGNGVVGFNIGFNPANADSVINFFTSSSGTYSNNLLANSFLEIRVYN